MKEKFLAFFTGKAGKAAYIIAASAAVCAVAVVSTVVVVHNNNQKLNSALESLSALTSESESVTEPSTEAEQTQTVSAQAANGSSGGSKQEDKAIQYLAEYNRLTEEYEKKRAALSEDLVCTAKGYNTVTKKQLFNTPRPLYPIKNGSETDEQFTLRVEQYKKDLAVWEDASRAYDVSVYVEESKAAEREKEAQSRAAEEKKRVENAQKQLDELDAQYKKDIEALKQKYGIK